MLVCHAALELLTSGDPPTSTSQSAGITGISQHARPHTNLFSEELGAVEYSRGQAEGLCRVQAGHSREPT